MCGCLVPRPDLVQIVKFSDKAKVPIKRAKNKIYYEADNAPHIEPVTDLKATFYSKNHNGSYEDDYFEEEHRVIEARDAHKPHEGHKVARAQEVLLEEVSQAVSGQDRYIAADNDLEGIFFADYEAVSNNDGEDDNNE